MAYSKKVVDKFENTLNNPEAFKVGRFDPKDSNVGTGMVGAPACGDVMKLQIKCEPKGNTHVIKDVKFKTYGCGSAIAASSLATIIAADPSFTPLAFPAVTVPFFLKGVGKLDNFSILVCLGCSSLSTIKSSPFLCLTLTGVISLFILPLEIAFKAFFWLLSANISWSSLLI